MEKMLMMENRVLRWSFNSETGVHTVSIIKETPNTDLEATTNLITEENVVDWTHTEEE